MAVNNRTEAQSEVTTALVATLTLAQHKALLNDEVLTSTVMRKDIIAVETPSVGAVTIDYSDKDTATVSDTVNLTVSFSGLENGDVKYLSITKTATNTVTFSGASDVSTRKTYINTIATVVVYEVTNKNGNIYVNSINIDNDINGGLITTPPIEIGDWDMDATNGVAVAHGLSDFTKIRTITCMIRSDDAASMVGLESANQTNATPRGAITSTDTTNVNLYREIGGGFDSTAFDSTSFNRGWVVIQHLP